MDNPKTHERTLNVYYDLPPELRNIITEYTKLTLEDQLLELPSFCWFKTRDKINVEDGVCSDCKKYGKGFWETIMITNSWLVAPLVTYGKTKKDVWQKQFPRSFVKFRKGGYACSEIFKEKDLFVQS
jgi:hypothetical protein